MPSPARQARRAQARRDHTNQVARSRRGRKSPDFLQGSPGARWFAVAGLLVVVALVVVIVLSSSSSSTSTPPLTGSGYPNVDTSNTRYVSGPIDEASVANLAQAWSLPLTAKSQYGSYSSAPIISGGVIYSEDLASNVQAIDLKTGKVLWSKSFQSPDQGPNGLVVQGGRVYGATATAAFALDQKTGHEVWSVTLVRNSHEGIDMAPGYHDGIVYVSTVPGNNQKFYGGGGVGIMWALEASTGRKLWHFNTVPNNLWSTGNASVNAGGGLWYPPAFDSHGFMYFGVANPAPFPGTGGFPWGSSRPGPDLYTDSIVKLDAATGKLQWYYQQTPHDLYDWDLQDPPILANVGGRQVVLAAGKSGVVVALDAATGKPLWKRSVGIHNGHDHDDSYAMKHEYSKLHLPETVYPGLLGGVIAPMATNGSTVLPARDRAAHGRRGRHRARAPATRLGGGHAKDRRQLVPGPARTADDAGARARRGGGDLLRARRRRPGLAQGRGVRDRARRLHRRAPERATPHGARGRGRDHLARVRLRLGVGAYLTFPARG